MRAGAGPKVSLLFGEIGNNITLGRGGQRSDLGDGGHADVSPARGAGAEGAGREHVEQRQHELGQEDEEGEVQERDDGLGLAATVGGALGDAVAVEVALVVARVGSDADGEGGGGGEGEHEVQEVPRDQQDGPRERGEQVGQHRVERVEHQRERGREDTEVDTGVAVRLCGDKRADETQHDHQEAEVDQTQRVIEDGKHCIDVETGM